MNSLMLSLHDQGKIDSHKLVADAIVGRLLKLVDSEEQVFIDKIADRPIHRKTQAHVRVL